MTAIVLLSLAGWAQTQSAPAKTAKTKRTTTAAPPKRAEAVAPGASADEVKSLRDELAEQRRMLQQMQESMRQRDAALEQLTSQLRAAQTSATEAQSKAAAAETAATQQAETVTQVKSDFADVKLNQTNAAVSTQADQQRMGAVESTVNRFRLSGDVRVRGESFFQDGAQDRWRSRIRLRLGIDGKLGEDFTGGMYIASGAVANGAPDFKDPVSTNETLTSFFERKTVGFDRGWVTYNPVKAKWLSLTGGKFAYSWNRTVLTFDSDLNPEGFNEKINRDFSNPVFKNFNVQAIQLLFNEVGGAPDSNASGGSFSGRLQLGKRWSLTPTYTLLNWNGADAIAQAASPAPRPAGTTAGVQVIAANAFTNASVIVNPNTATARRAFVSGFEYSDVILDNNITTPWARFPWRVLAEYEQNLRARVRGDKAYWIETSLGQQRVRNDFLFGYSFARVEQDSVISQFNESDMRAATNVVQHRLYANWLVRPNTTAAFTLWVGRTLDTRLQNAARAPGVLVGGVDPWLKRLQLDLIYKF